jgi:hypothetical protein
MSEAAEALAAAQAIDSRGAPRAAEPRASAPRDAKARAAELRKHLAANPIGTDKFALPSNTEPEGWTYEWKRWTTLNKEDPAYQTELAQAGWEPVPAQRHPGLMPKNYRGETIEREGMMLCERPTEIVEEAKARDLNEARMQVRSRETVLREEVPKGGAPRNHAKVGVTYGKDGIAVDD